MEKPDQFEITDECAIFRPTGHVSLNQAVQMVASAIDFARAQHIRTLMVNTSGLTGFEPPRTHERYFFIRDWARASSGQVRLAVVARPEMIDPQKFGVTVAANAGLVGDVFDSEEKALVWIRDLDR